MIWMESGSKKLSLEKRKTSIFVKAEKQPRHKARKRKGTNVPFWTENENIVQAFIYVM